MIKGLILLFNLLGVFLSGVLFPGTVSVTQTSPATAEINNSILVQVSINKGDVSGPASFVEHLPVGFRATAIDDESAHTSFDSNTIVFSWSSLPADANLNISFRIDINSLATVQNDMLNGKFLYTVNNEKLEADCSSSISITGTQVSAAQTSAPQNNTSSGSPIPQNSNVNQSDNSQQNTNSGEAHIVRQLSSISIAANSSATVTLVIHKPMGRGFARIEDTIPQGFNANTVSSAGASFTFIDNMAKFVWQNIPPDSVITVSYLLTASPNTSGAYTINGDFSYIYNQAPMSIYTGNTTLNVSSAVATNPVTQNNPVTAPVHIDSTPPLVVHKNIPLTTPVTSQTHSAAPAPEKTQPAEAKKDMAMPAKGVTYRVQIIALQKSTSITSLLNRKNIKEKVRTETSGGFTKYTIGSYTSFQSAEEAKNNMVRKGFYGAFVVCYKAGTRITLQEALAGN